MNIIKDKLLKEGYIVIIFAIIFKVVYSDTTFFWDSINCLSRIAHLIYDNDLSYFVYDKFYDNGDPHIIHFYLATIWTLFGKNLFVTHMAFLPFTVGCFYQVLVLVKNTFKNHDEKGLFTPILISCLITIADTSFLTQTILLGTDVCIIFFSLLTINQIIKDKKKLISLCFICLLITRRGMIISATLMIFYFLNHILKNKENNNIKNLLKHLLPTLPAILLVIVFIILRLKNTGWFFTSEDNAWAGTGDIVNLHQFIKNVIVLIWKNIDFGRFILWFFLIYTTLRYGFRSLISDETKPLWLCYILLQISFSLVTLPITNPFGTRYFITQFVLLSVIVSKILYDNYNKKIYKITMTIIFITLFSGSFWLYPEKIAMNWDCTLKHLSFYELRNECFEYMKEKNIKYSDITSGFCIYGNQEYIDLIKEERIIENKENEKKFYIYSNICNESDEKIDYLNSQFKEVKEFSKNGIFIKILTK